MMSAKGEAEARSGLRRHCFIVGAHFPTNRQIEHLANGAADPICPNEFLDWARTRYESAVNVASLAYLVHRRRSASLMAEMGHSRPMHSVPVPINDRCYSNSDIIVRRIEVTLRAKNRLLHCGKPAPCGALLEARGTCYVPMSSTDVIVRLIAPEERLRANRVRQHADV